MLLLSDLSTSHRHARRHVPVAIEASASLLIAGRLQPGQPCTVGSRSMGFLAVDAFAAVNTWYHAHGQRLPRACWARYADLPQWLELLPFLTEVATTTEEPVNRAAVKAAFSAAGRTLPDMFRQQILVACAKRKRDDGPGCP